MIRIVSIAAGMSLAVVLSGGRTAEQPVTAVQSALLGPPIEIRDAFPPDVRVDQITMSPDGTRTYFVDAKGDAYFYDRNLKTRTRISTGVISDVGVSAARDLIAFARSDGKLGDAHVFVMPLSAETGLSAGRERQLSASAGDVPSISPDGKWVAFARDDATGVGQSVVLVAARGGAERVVAPALPASVGSIRWTPDGKQLYIGVNPPVACVPDWSCLPLPGANRQPLASIRRVSVAGGPITTVVAVRGISPGLSPDGKTLVYADTGAVRRWVIAEPDGKRRDVIVLPPTQFVLGWLKGSTLLVPNTTNAKTILQAMDIAAVRSGNEK